MHRFAGIPEICRNLASWYPQKKGICLAQDRLSCWYVHQALLYDIGDTKFKCVLSFRFYFIRLVTKLQHSKLDCYLYFCGRFVYLNITTWKCLMTSVYVCVVLSVLTEPGAVSCSQNLC